MYDPKYCFFDEDFGTADLSEPLYIPMPGDLVRILKDDDNKGKIGKISLRFTSSENNYLFFISLNGNIYNDYEIKDLELHCKLKDIKCECGSEHVFKSKKFSSFHSNWCPAHKGFLKW